MRRIQNVIRAARFRTRESSGSLNLNEGARSLIVGRRHDHSEATCGLIGKVIESSTGHDILDYSVWLDLSFPHVIGVFGTRGTGKSFTLGVLAECIGNLPAVIHGSPPTAAAVLFDVQNQFWTMRHAPSDDLPEDGHHLAGLRAWGLAPAVLPNVAFWSPCNPDDHLHDARVFRLAPSQLRIDDWLAIVEQDRYSAMGQALLQVLRDSADHDPAVLAAHTTVRFLPSFQSTTVDALRWRLEAIAAMDLLGDPGVEISSLLRVGQLSVVFLRNLPDNMRALTAGVLSRLLAARMTDHHQRLRISRRRGADATPHGRLPDRLWVALDEAHLIVPSTESTPASAPLIDYVKRGRDSGLSLIFATQQPSAVDTRLMSQADITFTHNLCFETDIQAAIRRMPSASSHEYERDGRRVQSLGAVIRALEPGETIVADSASGRVFLDWVRPRLTAHGGNTPQGSH